METVKEIEKLRRNANSIYGLFKQRIPEWNSRPKHYDKTGWGFNKDARFNACDPVAVAFSSHMGTYGDSGCSSQCSLDQGLFAKHLLQYLNANVETVMTAIADQLIEDARSLREQAQAEVDELSRQLSNLDKKHENTI